MSDARVWVRVVHQHAGADAFRVQTPDGREFEVTLPRDWRFVPPVALGDVRRAEWTDAGLQLVRRNLDPRVVRHLRPYHARVTATLDRIQELHEQLRLARMAAVDATRALRLIQAEMWDYARTRSV